MIAHHDDDDRTPVSWTVRLTALLALVVGFVSPACADALATYRDGAYEILLMTQKCAPGLSGQRAYRRSSSSLLEGCWTVNARGNPVVRWQAGGTQELRESRVRLTPAYAALLDEHSAQSLETGFPRASWCKRAKYPHERSICTNASLAAADLALAPLWQSYRRKATQLEQARVKGEYFRRLKACGADEACIAGEQSAQTNFYRRSLGLQ